MLGAVLAAAPPCLFLSQTRRPPLLPAAAAVQHGWAAHRASCTRRDPIPLARGPALLTECRPSAAVVRDRCGINQHHATHACKLPMSDEPSCQTNYRQHKAATNGRQQLGRLT
jgi:hypothetical protein